MPFYLVKVIELGLYIKGVLWDIQDLLVFRPSGRKDIESLLAGEFSFERNQDNIGDSDHSSSRIMMVNWEFMELVSFSGEDDGSKNGSEELGNFVLFSNELE
ncbi:hypothetical protein M9H77_12511 [Catharanthus roseus]|uniref:Uncharacterized protein n=1 Tax=Catharanthus roseus TaxID=4058 RepID=A0ACC0BHS2_CATRO|nr:hypothetical protein M9H77_12511 [Catharanthus roseus]